MDRPVPPPTDPATALALAAAAWGADALETLGPEWTPSRPLSRVAPADALQALKTAHAAGQWCDLEHVHDSWIARALADESPAVRRIALRGLPPARRARLGAELGVAEADLEGDHRPHPDLARWVETAWAELLVGDLPLGPEDPEVLQVLTRWDSRRLARLLSRIGLAKHACHSDPSAFSAWEPRDQALASWFQSEAGEASALVAEVARRDLAQAGGTSAQALARVGLITVARLLSRVGAQRVRWTLQHLPYPIAKLIRPHMALDRSAVPVEELLAWEGRLFQLALRSVLDEEPADRDRDQAEGS